MGEGQNHDPSAGQRAEAAQRTRDPHSQQGREGMAPYPQSSSLGHHHQHHQPQHQQYTHYPQPQRPSDLHPQDWSHLTSAIPPKQVQPVRSDFSQQYAHFHPNIASNETAMSSPHSSMLSSPASWTHDPQSELEGSNFPRTTMSPAGLQGHAQSQGRQVGSGSVNGNTMTPGVSASNGSHNFATQRFSQDEDEQWNTFPGSDLQMHMQQAISDSNQSIGDLHNSEMYSTTENNLRQRMTSYPDAHMVGRTMYSDSSSAPYSAHGGDSSFSTGSQSMQHGSTFNFDTSSADDNLSWSSSLPSGLLEGFSSGGVRGPYTSNTKGGHSSADSSSSQGLSGFVSHHQGSGQSSGSTLAQAFVPTSAPSTQTGYPIRNASATRTSSPLANAGQSRQRASTLSTATMGGKRPSTTPHAHSPLFQRSLSSDGMTESLLEPERFSGTDAFVSDAVPPPGAQEYLLLPLQQQGGGLSHSSISMEQQAGFEGSGEYSSDDWIQAQRGDVGIQRVQQIERRPSGGLGGSRDSDSARLSLAMAKTRIGGPSIEGEQSQALQGPSQPSGLNNQIIEEEHDYGGKVDLLRRQFPQQNTMQFINGPQKLEVQYQDSGYQSSDRMPALDHLGGFGNAQGSTSFHGEGLQGVLQPLTVQRPPPVQQVQQSYPFGGIGQVPSALQRRYRPAVRPSTYQQLNIMDFEDSRDSTSHSSLELSNSSRNSPDSFIESAVHHYITTASRLGLGERTVLIMTSKVAQKSYGAEKRFLCPPPMVLLIGSSWWNVCQDSSLMGMRPQDGPSGPPTVLTPPRVNICMSGESNNQDGALEWATSSGRLIDVGNPSSEMAVSGRCIGKQLFITDVDEKRRTCETLVSVSVPGVSANDARLLGTFASKSIKIISKPSKKRQSNRNAELGIAHGSIVSLFHRLRSQTVSTRYLCVSGAPSWFKGSDGQPFLTLNSQKLPSAAQADQPSCFVAKMTSWDPFVIYLVDPKKGSVADPNAPPLKPPVIGYPSPPHNALEVAASGQHPLQIHYNQRIVLQCLNTAAVSPVMIIRKVDKATTVLGGVAASSARPTMDEAIGDPVSQLHKIALEVVDESTAPAPVAALNLLDGQSALPGASGAFLACLNESVGMRRPIEPRKWLWSSTAESGSSGPGGSPAMPSSSSSATQHQNSAAHAAAYAAAATRNALAQSRFGSGGMPGSSSSGKHSFSAGSATSGSPYIVPASHQQQLQQEQQLAEVSSDGGKVRRPRRVSSSLASPSLQQQRSGSLSCPSPTIAPATKGRRRGQSLSILEWQRAQAKQTGTGVETLPSSSSDSILGDIPSSAAWSAEVADSDIWTIVGTDIARHTFYVPPRIVGGVRPPSNIPDSGIAHLITTPAPSVPITPIPILHSFIPPSKSAPSSSSTSGDALTSTGHGGHNLGPDTSLLSQDRLVTLLGERLSENYHVYFGDWRSTLVQVQSSETLLCAPPPPASEAFKVPSIRLPIILVRKDGVIFPTECIYSV